MFKFMKSKKGFTLVELMIVVVIMAILVAVAVPIYSAVTANARKKTCIGNQREIVSSIGNYLMLNTKTAGATFTITTGGEADDGTWAESDAGGYDLATLKGLFKTTPFCPVANNKIVITIEAAAGQGEDKGYATCKTACQTTDGSITDHVLKTTA